MKEYTYEFNTQFFTVQYVKIEKNHDKDLSI